jgi:arylsulfatase A-like enzyme
MVKGQIDRRQFLRLLSLMSLSAVLETAHSATPQATSMPGSHQSPSILILLLDALSARHLSIHGYHRQTTPHLAKFADRATVYHSHYAAGNFTTPGTASLLTGVYPWSHRALQLDGQVADTYGDRNLFALFGDAYSRIAFAHNTLTHILLLRLRPHIDVYLPPEEFGLFGGTFPSQLFPNDPDIAYRSVEKMLFRDWKYPGSLFLGFGDKLRILARERGWEREFEQLYPRGIPTLIQHKWFFLLEDVIDGLIALMRGAQQPFLAYLHLFPPHEPYRPHRDFVGIFDDGWTPVTKPPHALSLDLPQEALNQWRLEYDEYLAFADAEFGRFYDALVETGVLDNSYVVLTSDHGQLFERGVHAHVTELLYEPIIHIPLLMSRPGQQQREDVYTRTNCVDLLPTLLDATERAIPPWCEGNVLPTSDTQEGPDERAIFSVEAKGNRVDRPLTKATIALLRGQYKLIHYMGYADYGNAYELYDLESDPEELENLYLSKKTIAADLQSEMQDKLRQVNEPYMA